MGQTGDQNSNDNVLNIQNDVDIQNKKHKCTYPECHAMFTRPSKLERHIRLHTGERPYKCNHEGCTKSYTNSSHLKRHLETHNPTKRVFVCPHCSMSISNLHNLKRHCKLMHSEDKKLVCKECGETFNKKHQLAQHKTIHFGPVIYKCDKCNHSFTSITKFKKDQKRHEKARDYVCTAPGCSEVFDKWIQLCVHRKTKHITTYICDTCNKSFFNKNKLRNHVKIHFENRLVLSCSYDNCNKTYFSKYNLETHVKIKHCGERFYCDICSMGLTSKRKLIEHIQRHYELKKEKKIKRIQKKKRKDAGIPKRSAITKLIGVDLPHSLEKMILQRESTTSKTEASDKNLNNTEIS